MASAILFEFKFKEDIITIIALCLANILVIGAIAVLFNDPVLQTIEYREHDKKVITLVEKGRFFDREIYSVVVDKNENNN